MKSILIPVFLLLLCVDSTAQQDLVPSTFKYPSGQVSSEGFMKNGKPEGFWKTYYENGQLKTEGNRREFKLDGPWTFYTSEGLVNELITYLAGKKEGVNKIYENGVLRQEFHFVNDTLSGVSFVYNDEGKVIKEIPFENNVENGKGYEFSSAGDITVIYTYKDGFVRNAERLNRVDKLSRKQGLWKTFYENRLVKTEGVYVDDLKNGLFKSYDEEGKLLTLEKYVNGVLNPDAAETTVLDIKNEYYPGGKIKASGSYKDGKKHGVHRTYDEEGNVLSSEIFEEGESISTGIVGKTGSFEGEWVTYYENGQVKAEGVFENGLRVKQWKFYHDNGQLSQRGNYQKGKPHGEWEWYYPSGSVRRTEYYRKGREDGDSVEYDSAGKVISKGAFIDGLKEGEWYYHTGDYIINGHYSDGEKDGKWLGTYEDGKKLFKGEFNRGLAVGKQRFYYANGLVKQEGKYNSGRRNGNWTIFTEEGEVQLIVRYKNGIETHLEGTKIIPTYQELDID